jgi:hypothetical protein
MPKATVSLTTERCDLKTLDGAWVELKRLTFGQKLERQQMATDMELDMGAKGKNQTAKVDIMTKAITVFDFQNCIVDHNLFEDDDETIKIDLSSLKGIAKLDPKVGDEIANFIDKLNNYDEDEELGN